MGCNEQFQFTQSWENCRWSIMLTEENIHCFVMILKSTKWGALNSEKWILAADKQSNDVVEQQRPHQ